MQRISIAVMCFALIVCVASPGRTPSDEAPALRGGNNSGDGTQAEGIPDTTGAVPQGP